MMKRQILYNFQLIIGLVGMLTCCFVFAEEAPNTTATGIASQSIEQLGPRPQISPTPPPGLTPEAESLYRLLFGDPPLSPDASTIFEWSRVRLHRNWSDNAVRQMLNLPEVSSAIEWGNRFRLYSMQEMAEQIRADAQPRYGINIDALHQSIQRLEAFIESLSNNSGRGTRVDNNTYIDPAIRRRIRDDAERNARNIISTKHPILSESDVEYRRLFYLTAEREERILLEQMRSQSPDPRELFEAWRRAEIERLQQISFENERNTFRLVLQEFGDDIPIYLVPAEFGIEIPSEVTSQEFSFRQLNLETFDANEFLINWEAQWDNRRIPRDYLRTADGQTYALVQSELGRPDNRVILGREPMYLEISIPTERSIISLPQRIVTNRVLYVSSMVDRLIYYSIQELENRSRSPTASRALDRLRGYSSHLDSVLDDVLLARREDAWAPMFHFGNKTELASIRWWGWADPVDGMAYWQNRDTNAIARGVRNIDFSLPLSEPIHPSTSQIHSHDLRPTLNNIGQEPSSIEGQRSGLFGGELDLNRIAAGIAEVIPENQAFRPTDLEVASEQLGYTNTPREVVENPKPLFELSRLQPYTNAPERVIFRYPTDAINSVLIPAFEREGNPPTIRLDTLHNYLVENNLITLPTPENHSLSHIIIRNANGDILQEGTDYRLRTLPDRSTYYAEILNPNVHEVSYSASFRRGTVMLDAAFNPEILYNLNHERLLNLARDLERSGIQAIADSIRSFVRQRQGEAISVIDITNIFRGNSLYSYDPEQAIIPEEFRSGRFADYSRFLNADGRICAQCDTTNSLYTEFLTAYFEDNPDVTIRTRRVIVVNDFGQLTSANLHRESEFYIRGTPVLVQDATPPLGSSSGSRLTTTSGTIETANRTPVANSPTENIPADVTTIEDDITSRSKIVRDATENLRRRVQTAIEALEGNSLAISETSLPLPRAIRIARIIEATLLVEITLSEAESFFRVLYPQINIDFPNYAAFLSTLGSISRHEEARLRRFQAGLDRNGLPRALAIYQESQMNNTLQEIYTELYRIRNNLHESDLLAQMEYVNFISTQHGTEPSCFQGFRRLYFYSRVYREGR